MDKFTEDKFNLATKIADATYENKIQWKLVDSEFIWTNGGLYDKYTADLNGHELVFLMHATSWKQTVLLGRSGVLIFNAYKFSEIKECVDLNPLDMIESIIVSSKHVKNVVGYFKELETVIDTFHGNEN